MLNIDGVRPLNTKFTQKIPHESGTTGLPRLKGGFNGLRRLTESQIIPLKILIALYQTRRNEVTGEEQYQINNPPNPISFFYKY